MNFFRPPHIDHTYAHNVLCHHLIGLSSTSPINVTVSSYCRIRIEAFRLGMSLAFCTIAGIQTHSFSFPNVHCEKTFLWQNACAIHVRAHAFSKNQGKSLLRFLRKLTPIATFTFASIIKSLPPSCTLNGTRFTYKIIVTVCAEYARSLFNSTCV